MHLSELVRIGLVVAVPLIAGRPALAGIAIEDLGGDQFRVTFSFAAPAGTKAVHLAGSFNGWSTTHTPMNGPTADGRFHAELVLPKGEHEYKFVVDGSRWEPDPDNPDKVPPHSNAILRLGVGKSARPQVVPDPVDMARRAEHPREANALFTAFREIWKIGCGNCMLGRLQRLLDQQAFPIVTDSTVTFVCAELLANDATVAIAGDGFRTGYLMDRLDGDSGPYVLTLRRGDIPDRAVYTLEFEIADTGKTFRMSDPHGYFTTSRGGRPVSVIAAPNPKSGRIVYIRDVPPCDARKPCDLYVYLPPGYDANTTERYPVVYAHDGQNLWDDPTEPFGHGGWQLNVTADRLIGQGKVRPFIAVGIPNSHDRMKEYGPGRSIFDDSDHAYLWYIKTDVKPLIDQRFRTSPKPQDTAIMGSSMGGIISLQAALLHPDLFGAAACLSPAFQFKDADGKTYSDLIEKAGHVPVRLYVDHGTAGAMHDGAAATEAMVELLRKTGWQEGEDLEYFVDTGADHNECAWRARLERPLRFLFGTAQADHR